MFALLLLVFTLSVKSFSKNFELDKGKQTSFVQKQLGSTKSFRINSISDDNQEDLSEVELDDLDIFIFGINLVSNSVLYVEKLKVSEAFQYFKATKLPLYVLFCKWKFHLS